MEIKISTQPADEMQRFYQTGKLPAQEQAECPSAEAACSAETRAAIRHACHHLLREAEKCRQRAVKYEHADRPNAALPWHNKSAAFHITVKALETLLPQNAASTANGTPH